MMEMRLPTREELHAAYERDMMAAFPPTELRPLAEIETAYDAGWYHPWCLFDGSEIVGEAFVLEVKTGFVLFDYLCICRERRNGGIGGELVKKLLEAEAGNVLFGEVEIPALAEDPVLAERRKNFYHRLGARQAGYDTALFGVPYHTLYWSDGDLDEKILCAAHREGYRKSLSEKCYAKNVIIPWDGKTIPEKVGWGDEA